MGYHNDMTTRGFSLVEVIIVSAVVTVFFGGLFLTISTSLRLIADSRGRLTALTVANDYMEYVRSLSYDNVGTVSGLPPGLLPQVSTTTVNGIDFTRRLLVEYVDDAADGQGAADSNGITTDYKQAKISVTWTQQGTAKEVFLVSNVVPRSIETNVGGGTIRVNVFDAEVAPLPGATVRLRNTTGTTTVDVTRTTDASGVALFGGAPAGAGYEIFVSRSGYSADQTYVATTSLPFPATQPVAVVAADITTMNFFIDELSGLAGTVYTDRVYASSSLDFVTLASVASSTGVVVSGGALALAPDGGGYVSTGIAYLTPIAPTTLAEWVSLARTATVGSGTSVRLRLYTGASSTAYTLIPDSVVPGNAAGLVDPTVALASLDPTEYPAVVVGVTLATTNTTVTPTVTRVQAWYVETQSPYGNAGLTLVGAKSIGTDSLGNPVYKTAPAVTTESDGVFVVAALEWDSYQFEGLGFDLAEVCPGYPLVAEPGATTTATVTLAPDTAHTLRVVATAGGVPLPGAVVEIRRNGSPDSRVTSPCGQAFFTGVAEAEYEVTVSASGYAPVSVSNLFITGETVYEVAL